MESTQKESLAIDLRPWIRGESPFPRRDLLQEGQLERQGEFRLADLAAAGEVAGEKLKDLGVLTAGLDLRDHLPVIGRLAEELSVIGDQGRLRADRFGEIRNADL